MTHGFSLWSFDPVVWTCEDLVYSSKSPCLVEGLWSLHSGGEGRREREKEGEREERRERAGERKGGQRGAGS